MVHNDFLNVLPEMVAFAYVAQTGSFSAAARQLHLTSSAINEQISKLEKTLGVHPRHASRFILALQGCKVLCNDLNLFGDSC
jgi:inorganic triphosphatase YgiF